MRNAVRPDTRNGWLLPLRVTVYVSFSKSASVAEEVEADHTTAAPRARQERKARANKVCILRGKVKLCRDNFIN
jgi:hypothetical protein